MTTTMAVVLTALLFFPAGGVFGYYYARAEVWWTKKKMGWGHVGDLVKMGGAVMLVIFVAGVGGLKYLGII